MSNVNCIFRLQGLFPPGNIGLLHIGTYIAGWCWEWLRKRLRIVLFSCVNMKEVLIQSSIMLDSNFLVLQLCEYFTIMCTIITWM